MSRARDISIMLSKTEVDNTSNLTLLNSSSELGLDSAQVQAIGTTVYTSLDSLPSTGLVSGQQAWVESSGRLYISNGSGWYNIALVNASPTLSLDRSGTIQLNADTLSVVVTATATDADDNQDIISFSVESDGNMAATGTSVTQDSSVFTITAISEDSGGVNGNFTLTFKATDQIAVDNESLSFSLAFSNVVDSSSSTILLMKARNNSETNTNITFLDSNQSSIGFTEYSAPSAGSFSPYRPGGYSAYFVGADDYLTVTDSTDFDFGTGDFTMEGWYYFQGDTSSGDYYILNFTTTSGNGHFGVNIYNGGWRVGLFNGSLITGTTGIETNAWHHFAWVRESGTMKFYVDGTQVGSDVSYSSALDCSGTFRIGTYADTPTYGEWLGYLRDIRVVKGTAVYTAAFTPPTEALTAITNTVLLACHAPYFGDGSTNNHVIISEGEVSTQPFGPYDFEPWVDSDYGGSVRFDGTDDYIVAATSGGFGFLTGDFTIEMWVYADLTASGDYLTTFGFNNQGINHSLDKFRYYHGTLGGSNVMYSTGATGHAYSWNHVAVTRESGTTRIFANGKLGSSTTVSHNWPDYAIALGCTEAGTGAFMYNGHIADARYVKGTALYTADFTPPTAPLPHVSGTVLRMNNKSDTNIYDASASQVLQIEGDPVSSTTQRKFTTSSSVDFDGTDQLRIQDGEMTPSAFGTDDWTIEGWIYSTSSSAQYVWGDVASSGSNNTASHFLLYETTGITAYNYTDQNNTLTGSEATAANTWHHIAVTREGSTFRLFVNGVLDASTTNAVAMNNSTVKYAIGGIGDYNSKFTGYIQDFRITKGLARYTANFTPPTAEFEL